MALIRQLMNVTNVVSQENLIAQVKALFVRNVATMTVQSLRNPTGLWLSRQS